MPSAAASQVTSSEEPETGATAVTPANDGGAPGCASYPASRFFGRHSCPTCSVPSPQPSVSVAFEEQPESPGKEAAPTRRANGADESKRLRIGYSGRLPSREDGRRMNYVVSLVVVSALVDPFEHRGFV